MKKTITLTLWLGLLTLASILQASELEDAFNRGNNAYQNEAYGEAINAWQAALTYGHTPALHYNLGNAYVKEGAPGKAILHYRKALALAPGYADAQANLQHALKSQTLSLRRDALARYSHAFSVNTWSWLAAICGWSFLALLLFSQLLGYKGPLRAMLLLLLLLGTSACGAGLYGYHITRNDAVILTAESPLKVAPTQESPAASYLVAGKTVQINKGRDDYYLVTTDTGKSGWMNREDVGMIWE